MVLRPLATIPASWDARLRGYEWIPQPIGQSRAAVFRLLAAARPTLFVKVEPRGPFAEVAHETARLHWMARQGLLCAEVLDVARTGGHDWLLTTAVEGQDLAMSHQLPPARRIAILAEALARLHRLPVEDCPFDHRLPLRLAAARARVMAAEVDETDFDDRRVGRSAAELFALLESMPQPEADLVVTHGDACLPNIMATADGFSGYVDCGRLGVADRYQDLALAARSIAFNLGEQWVVPFFQAYSVPTPDEGKRTYYELLDEFF